MRFNEFYVNMTKSTLLEDKQQYRAIINSVVRAEIIDQAEGDKVFKDVRAVLKRSDRISWWLKWWRLSKFYDSWNQISDDLMSALKDARQRGDTGQKLAKPFSERFEKFNAAFEKATKQDSGLITDSEFKRSIEDFKKHFGNLDQLQQKWPLGQSPEVDAFRWDSYTQAAKKSIISEPKMLYHDLLDAEREWKNQLRKKLNQIIEQSVEPQPGDRVILDYGDYAWVKLDREYCQAEARAMKHCGNADYKPGDRIFSLRSKVSDHVSLIDSAIKNNVEPENREWDIDNLERLRNTELQEPHLTFILDKNGLFGEMKGQANSKPKEKYHPYIVDLILQDFVKGFKPGIYLPENDFKISDLSKKLLSQVARQKPEFVASADVLRFRGINDPVFYERLKAELNKHEIPYTGIDSVNHSVILAEEPSIDRLLRRFYIMSDSAEKVSMLIKNDKTDHQKDQFYLHAQDMYDNLRPADRAAVITYIKNNYPTLTNQNLEIVDNFIDDIDKSVRQAFYHAVGQGKQLGNQDQMILTYREWMEENNIRYDPAYEIFYLELSSREVSLLIEQIITEELARYETVDEKFQYLIGEQYLSNSDLDDLISDQEDFDSQGAAEYLGYALVDLGILEE